MSREPSRRLVVLLLAVGLSVLLAGRALRAEEKKVDASEFTTFCDKTLPAEERIKALVALLGQCACQTHISEEDSRDYRSRLLPFLMDEAEPVNIRVTAMRFHQRVLPGLTPEYIALASSKEPELKRSALRAIAELDNGKIVRKDIAPLTKMMSEALAGSDSEMIDSALQAAENFDLPVKVALINAVIKTPDGSFRRYAIELAGKLGNSEAIPILKECVEKDTGYGDGENALKAIGRIGNADSIPYLVLKMAAANVRSRDNFAQAVALFGDAAVNSVATLIRNDDIDIRRCAITAIGNCGGPTARAILVRSCSDGRLTYWAAEALGKLGDPAGGDAIYSVLKYFREWDYWTLVLGLADCGDRRAIGHLISMLDCYGSKWREQAADRLGKLGPGEFAEAMARKLRPDTNPPTDPQEFNVHVLIALENFHDEKAAAVLIEELCRNKVDWQQAQIIQTLGEMGCPIAIPAVLDALKNCPLGSRRLHNIGKLQIALCVACARLGVIEARDKIAAFANSKDPSVRAAVLFALVLLGDKSKLAELIAMDPSSRPNSYDIPNDPETGEARQMRVFFGDQVTDLIWYLAEIGGKEAMAALARIARSDCDRVARGAAVLELGRLAIPANKNLFEELLADYTVHVRVCAAYVLFKYYKSDLRMDIVTDALIGRLYVTRNMATKCLKEAKGITVKE